MEIKQFLGIRWKNENPMLTFYNKEKKKLEEYECSGNINIQNLNIKRCTGYYDLEERKLIPCPTYKDLTNTQYSQCYECQKQSGFNICLGCNGNICKANNNKAKDFCNQSHHIYLAYFANDKLKVGTAASHRKYERLLEQGAIYSIFLSKAPNGKIARKIENDVSEIGYTKQVNSLYKMNNFIIDKTEKEINKILLENFNKILKHIDEEYKQYFLEPECNNFTYISDNTDKYLKEETSQLNLFYDKLELTYKEYLNINKPEIINGEIRNVVGKIILIEKNKEFSVVNTKKIEGFEVQILY